MNRPSHTSFIPLSVQTRENPWQMPLKEIGPADPKIGRARLLTLPNDYSSSPLGSGAPKLGRSANAAEKTLGKTGSPTSSGSGISGISPSMSTS